MAAPTEFTVEQVVQAEDWTNNDSQQMTTYQLVFEGDPKHWKAYRNHANGHPEARAGEVVSGWKNHDKGTFGFAKPKGSAPGGHRPRGGSGGGEGPGLTWRSAPFERGAEHPRNEARAIHTSAMSAAPDYYRLLREETGTDGKPVLPQPKDLDHAKRTLMAIAVWLEETYQGALGGAESPPAPAQEVPADTDGLSTAGRPSISPDDQIGF